MAFASLNEGCSLTESQSVIPLPGKGVLGSSPLLSEVSLGVDVRRQLNHATFHFVDAPLAILREPFASGLYRFLGQDGHFV